MKPSLLFRNYQNPDGREPGVLAEVEKFRYLGYRGGIIFKHRSMLTLHRNLSKTLSSALLSLVLLAGWLAVLNRVTSIWGRTLNFWREVLGLGGYVTSSNYSLWNIYHFQVPYLHVAAGPPDYLTLWIGGWATVGLFLITFFLPRRYLPFIYLIRIAVFFHACAQVFFAFVPYSFPYGASGYIHGVLTATLVLISLMPILLGFTFYVFDFKLTKKIIFSLVLMAYLGVVIPLQYMAQALVMYHLSLLFLPILFFVFGLPLNVMMFMGFYSWGASWRDAYRRENPPRASNGRQAARPDHD